MNERPVAVDWKKLAEECQFRTLIGPPGAPITCSFAALGEEVTALSVRMMGDVLDAFRAGGRVLVLSDRVDLRDRAKREILAMLQPMGRRA